MPDTCPHCGKPVRPTARFCHACGGALRSAPPPRPQPGPPDAKIFIAPGQPTPPAASEGVFPPKATPRTEPPPDKLKAPPVGGAPRPAMPEGPRIRAGDQVSARPEHRPEPRRRVERGQAALEDFQPPPRQSAEWSGGGEKPAALGRGTAFAPTESLTGAAPKAAGVSQDRPDPAPTFAEPPARRRGQPLTLNLRGAELPQAQSDDLRRAAAEPLGPAEFGLRFGAFMLDFLLTLIAIEVVLFAFSSFGARRSFGSSVAVVLVTFVLIYTINEVALPALTGQTVGKKILGIQIVREDGRPFDFVGALKRHLIGYPLSAAALMLGFLWILWDPKQQGWHDKLSQTTVVKII